MPCIPGGSVTLQLLNERNFASDLRNRSICVFVI